MTQRDDEDAELAAAWEAFAAEAEELLAIDPEDMTPEQHGRLERMSDPLFDLYGYEQRSRPDSSIYDDPRLLEWLARQGALDGEDLLGGERLLSSAEIRALSRRVLQDLDADRLGMMTPLRTPEPRLLDFPGPVSAVVDEAMERHESALVDLGVAAGSGRALWEVECDSCMPLPAELPRGRHLALRVSGESMEPVVHAGDVIVVRLGADVARDTVVVARGADDGYVVKRVGVLSRRSVELLSLNPAFPPVRIQRLANAVLGTVVLRWCAHDREQYPHPRL